MRLLNLKPALFFVFAATFSSAAFSNETQAADMPTDGAKLVEAKGCIACHGKDGNGVVLAGKTDPQYPILAGQYASYIEFALKAYRGGTRKNIIMAGFAEKLTDAEVKALAHYFSSQSSKLHTLKGLE